MMLRLFALFSAPLLTNASSETQFLNRTVTSNGVAYRYVVSVPANWSADRTWPTVLFLHGSNERGEDGIVQSRVGLALAVRKYPERFPAIVVMPQCRPDADWRSPAMEAQILAGTRSGYSRTVPGHCRDATMPARRRLEIPGHGGSDSGGPGGEHFGVPWRSAARLSDWFLDGRIRHIDRKSTRLNS